MTKITFQNLKGVLSKEGYHILVFTDSQVKRISGFSSVLCQEDKNIKGLVLPDRNEIIINKKLLLKERVLTLIHELIHILLPRLSETKTEKEAKKLYSEFSDSDLGFFEFAVSHSS